jgi:AcrR family transcriptional regulator
MRSAAKPISRNGGKATGPRARAKSPVKSSDKPQAWNVSIVDRAEEVRRKRRAVIVAAARAFGHRGFHNVSLDEVAVALNVSKPTLYNYFKSKHELLYECYNLALDFGDEVIREVQALDGTGLEKLTTFIKRYIAMLTERLGPAAVFYEFYSMRPNDREKIQRRRRGFDKIFRQLVSEGIADGSIASCDPKLAVFWFMGSITGITRWFDPNGELSGEEIANAFVAFIKNGLAAPDVKPARRG